MATEAALTTPREGPWCAACEEGAVEPVDLGQPQFDARIYRSMPSPKIVYNWVNSVLEEDRRAMHSRHQSLLDELRGLLQDDEKDADLAFFVERLPGPRKSARQELLVEARPWHQELPAPPSKPQKPDETPTRVRGTEPELGMFQAGEPQSSMVVAVCVSDEKLPAAANAAALDVPTANSAATAESRSEGMKATTGRSERSTPLSPSASERVVSASREAKKRLSFQSKSLGDTIYTTRTVRTEEEIMFGRLEKIVLGSSFEVFFGMLIVANAVVMAVEAQFEGTVTGGKVGYYNYAEVSETDIVTATSVFSVFDWFFGVLFTLELLLKVMCFRKSFATDCWNLIDTIIVIGWISTTAAGSGNPLVVDPMLLRLARLVRLLRLGRLVRTVTAFDSLFLMTTAMRGSVSVLVWTMVLLVLVLMMCALMLQVSVEPYINDENMDPARSTEIFKYYGSFARTMLTMFEITLGNWLPPCRALVENINEWFIIFFICHKLVIGFSVVAVITGVFIQETFKVASQDDGIMMMQKKRAMKLHLTKMKALFDHLDDGDGALTLDEFRNCVHETAIKTWLSAMDLDVRDVDAVFWLLDDGDGKLSAEELVRGVSHLKGAARSIDMMALMKQMQRQGDLINALGAKFGIKGRQGPSMFLGQAHTDDKQNGSEDNAEPGTEISAAAAAATSVA